MKATRDQATAAVLGAVFLSDAALDTLADERIRPAHFHRPGERAVYDAMLALRDSGEPVDTLTVKAKLEHQPGPWRDVTDMRATVDLLAGSVPAVAHLRGYCQIVRDEAWFEHAGRQLHHATEAVHRRDRAGLLAALADVDAADNSALPPDPAREFVDWYESDRKGIPLPFPVLTEMVGGGLAAGEVTVLGGWSRMGKTFWLKDMLLAATEAGARCHEYANEMSGPRRTARLLASLTGIPEPRVRKKQLTGEEWDTVRATVRELPYVSTPTAGWSVEDYCRAIRREKWDLAAIDTVTNLGCRDVAEWDRACVMLADAAAQSGTHLIEVCQLNQERDKGQIQPPPTGRDLRNTGAWFQRARVVLFLHRDQELVDGTGIRRELPDGHVRVDKATHGDLSAGGFVPVTFNPRWLRFDRQVEDWRQEIAA